MTMIQEISIPDSLYEEASNLAQEMQISPSDLFSLAIENYLHRHRSQKLLQSINDAYTDGLDKNEQAMLEGMRRHQRQLVQNE
jgi:metal-responsive CopG/Arc/MetJ family transcriptional regulator